MSSVNSKSTVSRPASGFPCPRRTEGAMKRRAVIVFIVLVSFGAGFGLGRIGLSHCKAENKLLSDDLQTAVKRGVMVEAHLILCQQQQGAKK